MSEYRAWFRRMGRPSKLTTATAHTAEVLARLGFKDEKLAAAIGISRSTLHEWRKANPDFADTLNAAKTSADARVMDALYQRATGYEAPDGTHIPPHPTAIIFYLKNRRPAEWRDVTRSEISGPDGAPIQAAAPMIQLSQEQDDALARVITEAQARVRQPNLLTHTP